MNFRSIIPVPWRYKPKGCLSVVAGNLLTSEMHRSSAFCPRIFQGDSYIRNALEEFVTFNLPPIVYRIAYICDGESATILGYHNDGENTVWGGTQWGFEWLAHYWDPLEVVEWETQAGAFLHHVPEVHDG